MAIVEDKSAEAITFLQGRIINYRVDRGLTTYADNTKDVLGVETGYKDKARGNGEIETVEFLSGSLQRIDAQFPGIPILWAADFVFNIRYKANSQAERWVYPGGAFVDRLWNGNTSRGTIKATLSIKPQTNGTLVLDISVDPDADDRPGNFVKEYIAPLFKDAIDNSLEQFTGTTIS
jgi:hypothetical protein